MRFVLGGVRHELRHEDIVAAARRVVLDDIDGRHKYYVLIEGRRLPVKLCGFPGIGRGRIHSS